MKKTSGIIKSILSEQILMNKTNLSKANSICENKNYTDAQKGQKIANLIFKSGRETSNNCTTVLKIVQAMGGNKKLADAVYDFFKNPYQVSEDHEVFAILDELDAKID